MSFRVVGRKFDSGTKLRDSFGKQFLAAERIP